jgi:hypothetical protein
LQGFANAKGWIVDDVMEDNAFERGSVSFQYPLFVPSLNCSYTD